MRQSNFPFYFQQTVRVERFRNVCHLSSLMFSRGEESDGLVWARNDSIQSDRGTKPSSQTLECLRSMNGRNGADEVRVPIDGLRVIYGLGVDSFVTRRDCHLRFVAVSTRAINMSIPLIAHRHVPPQLRFICFFPSISERRYRNVRDQEQRARSIRFM